MVQMSLREGLILSGILYENPPLELEQTTLLQRLPGVVLVAGTQGEWETLPEQLRDAGFTVKDPIGILDRDGGIVEIDGKQTHDDRPVSPPSCDGHS